MSSDPFPSRATSPMYGCCIDEDNPALLFDWQLDNVNTFVAAANSLDPAEAPPWLRTRPPHMTSQSFMDDLIYTLQGYAGGRCGWILLAPNDLRQYTAMVITLATLQNDGFLQDATQVALPVVNNVEQYLAVTYYLTDPRTLRPRPNNLPPYRRNDIPLRRLFI